MLLTITTLALMIAQQKAPDAAAAGAGMFLCCACPLIVFLGVFVPAIIAQWKIFDKAGEPGWASLVPIYNVMVVARIIGKDEVWGLLVFIPIVGIYFGIVMVIELAKAFGKDVGFAIGMILLPLIFYPILGFGSARYIGPGGVRRRRRRDDDDDDDSRAPRMRRRDDDDDDRVRRSDEDDEEDRPRRRRRPRDDDDD